MQQIDLFYHAKSTAGSVDFQLCNLIWVIHMMYIVILDYLMLF